MNDLADIDIEHVDLDTPDDDGDDTPSTAIYVSILTTDGMRYSASVSRDGDLTVDELADMVARSVTGATAAHSPELRRALRVERRSPS